MLSAPLMAWTLVALGVLLSALTAAIGLRKAGRERRDRHRAAVLGKLRPVLLAVLDEDADGDAAATPGDAELARHPMLDELAAGMIGKLRGSDRERLVTWLGERGTLAEARQALTARSSVRRARAAELLGRAADGEARDQLIALLADRDRDVRAVAARALGKLGDSGAVQPLLASIDARHPIPTTIVTMALLHIGPAAVGPLTEALATASPRGQAIAAELLGLHGSYAAVGALLGRLQCDAATVRAAAAHALGRIGTPEAAPALAATLERDHSLEVQIACARALGEVGGDGAVFALELALCSGVPALAHVAAAGLLACGEPGFTVLRTGETSAAPWAAHAREALFAGLTAAGAHR